MIAKLFPFHLTLSGNPYQKMKREAAMSAVIVEGVRAKSYGITKDRCEYKRWQRTREHQKVSPEPIPFTSLRTLSPPP